MMHVEGFFKGDDPCVGIQVHGKKHDPPGVNYDAIVDSGFNQGYLLMSMREGFELGLERRGTTTYQVGNGEPLHCLVTSGTVTFAGKTVSNGAILLADDVREVLLGPAFFRLFRVKVVIGARTVDIYDEEWLDRALLRTDGKGGGR